MKNPSTSRTFSRNFTFVFQVSSLLMGHQNHLPVFFGQNFKATILSEDAFMQRETRDRSFYVVIGE